MHDSGDDLHHLPSYEKCSGPQPDSRSDLNASAAPSMENNLLMKGLIPFEMENPCEPEAHISSKSDYVRFVKNVAFSKCSHCGRYAVWVRDKLVYPFIE
jgi:hypothetical protein